MARAPDLIELQSSRVATLQRDFDSLVALYGQAKADLAAARDMIRDLCIGHRDNCVCRCCESVFRIDAKGDV